MSKPVNKTMIGIFVVIAVALVVCAVLILGSGKFFKNNPKFVMYFDGSVKGLQVGAPVIFQGVKIGSVIAIKMFFNPKDYAIRIPVYVELEQSALQAVPGGADTQEAFKKIHGTKGFLIKALIDRGLRAQLEMQSVVTGQLEVALDFHPETKAKFLGAEKGYTEIPTVPTTLQLLAEKVGKFPLEKILVKLERVAEGIDRLVTSREIDAMVKSYTQMAVDGKTLVRDVDLEIKPLASKFGDAAEGITKLTAETESNIGPLAANLTKTSNEASFTLKRIQAAADNIDDLTAENSAVFYRLTRTITELEATARSLRLLSDILHQQPDSIIFGKKN